MELFDVKTVLVFILGVFGMCVSVIIASYFSNMVEEMKESRKELSSLNAKILLVIQQVEFHSQMIREHDQRLRGVEHART